MMEDVLVDSHPERQLPLSILLDDVSTVDDDVWQNLVDAAETICRITSAGVMIGPGKCFLAIEEGRHLGDWWTSGGTFRPPAGKLAALLEFSDTQLRGMGRS